jgi:hypothetical protein
MVRTGRSELKIGGFVVECDGGILEAVFLKDEHQTIVLTESRVLGMRRGNGWRAVGKIVWDLDWSGETGDSNAFG